MGDTDGDEDGEVNGSLRMRRPKGGRHSVEAEAPRSALACFKVRCMGVVGLVKCEVKKSGENKAEEVYKQW